MNRYFLIVFIIIATVASLIKGQNFCWDCLHYHYYNGWAFWNNRLDTDITPADGLHTYFTPLLDALEYWAFYHFPSYIFAIIMGSISGIGIYFVFRINQIILKNARLIEILLATLISTTGIAHIMQLGSITNENVVAVFLIIGLYYQLIYCQSPKMLYLIFSGAALGIALGTKLTAITGVFGILTAFLLVDLKIINNWSRYLVLGVSFLSAFILIDGFWMLKMYYMFHNPIYPNFNHLFGATSDLNFSRDTQYIPQSWESWLLLPFYLMIKTANITDFSAIRDWHFAVTIVSVIIYCITVIFYETKNVDPISKKQWKILLITFVVSYICWEYLFSIQRYTIFIEYMSGIIVVYIILRLTNQKSVKNILLVMSAILMIGTIKSANIGYAPLSANIKTLPNLHISNALVILDSGTSYLAPMLGASNVYINLPESQLDDTKIQTRKKQLLEEYLKLNKGVYLIYDTADINIIQSQSWIISNRLQFKDCTSIKAFKMSYRMICKLTI